MQRNFMPAQTNLVFLKSSINVQFKCFRWMTWKKYKW